MDKKDFFVSTIGRCVYKELNKYFNCLSYQEVTGLYELVLKEIEAPLLKVVMDKTKGNRTHAAKCLGISRRTLQQKLKKYQKNDSSQSINPTN